MSAEIVNLRRARKARARADKDANAAANRARFGSPKAERDARSAADTLDRRRLDAHRIAGPDGDPPANS